MAFEKCEDFSLLVKNFRTIKPGKMTLDSFLRS